MITLNDNRLTIWHDEDNYRIKAQLYQKVDAYIAEWLPRVLAENLSQCLEKLLQREFDWWSEEKKVDARQAMAEETPERVEYRFRKIVAQKVGSFEPKGGAPSAEICFQRTLRIPDDGRTYPLPPGMGTLPIRKKQITR